MNIEQPSNGGERIRQAIESTNLSQRAIATKTGISQATLSRIASGDRAAKISELAALSQVTGWSISALTGLNHLADRVQYAARATNGSDMAEMREIALRYLDLSDFLHDQGIS